MNIASLKNMLDIPIIAAPMFLVSGTDLVIECCKNGIVGSFPSLNGRTKEDFEKMLRTVTDALTAHDAINEKPAAPFAVNLIVNKTNERLMGDLQLCIQYKVPVVITSLGAVKEVVDAIHGYGGLVFHDVIQKRHAEKAAEAGVDGIICVSAGAGGHAGTAHPFALVNEIKSFYKGAIIMAGSINSGKEILASEVIGADFAYMGTRFIATHESLASKAYKDMILDASIDDIVYTNTVSGVNANFLRQSIDAADMKADMRESREFLASSHSEAKAWKNVWSAGHGASGIHMVLSVRDLVESLKAEYQEAVLSLINKQ